LSGRRPERQCRSNPDVPAHQPRRRFPIHAIPLGRAERSARAPRPTAGSCARPLATTRPYPTAHDRLPLCHAARVAVDTPAGVGENAEPGRLNAAYAPMRTSRASGATHPYRCVAPAPCERSIRTNAAFAASRGPHGDASGPSPNTRSATSALGCWVPGCQRLRLSPWQSGSGREPEGGQCVDGRRHAQPVPEQSRCPEAGAKTAVPNSRHSSRPCRTVRKGAQTDSRSCA